MTSEEIRFRDDDDSGLVWLENEHWPEETDISGMILRDLTGTPKAPEFLNMSAENGRALYRISDYDLATDVYHAVLQFGEKT
jgi:hypothetical protein